MDTRTLSHLAPELKTQIATELNAIGFFNTAIHLVDKEFSDISRRLLQKDFKFFSSTDNETILIGKKHLHAAEYLYQNILRCKRHDQANRLYGKLFDGISSHPNEPSFQFYFGLILLNGKTVKRNNSGFDLLKMCIDNGDYRATQALIQFYKSYSGRSQQLINDIKYYIQQNEGKIILLLTTAHQQKKQTAESLADLYHLMKKFDSEMMWLEQAVPSPQIIKRLIQLKIKYSRKNTSETEYLTQESLKELPPIVLAEIHKQLADYCQNTEEALAHLRQASELNHIDAANMILQEFPIEEIEKNKLLMLLFRANDINATQEHYIMHKDNFTLEIQDEFKQAFFNGNHQAIKLMSLYARGLASRNPSISHQHLWWIQLAADVGDEDSFSYLVKNKHHCALTMLYLYGQAYDSPHLLVRTTHEFDCDKTLIHFAQIQPEKWNEYLNVGVEQDFITQDEKKDINNRIERLKRNVAHSLETVKRQP